MKKEMGNKQELTVDMSYGNEKEAEICIWKKIR